MRKIHYPAADRNKTFILDVLRSYITQLDGKLLEIASGTGQHAAFIASNMPQLSVQPSEVDGRLLESIKCYAQEVPGQNMKCPVRIDVENPSWDVDTDYDYLLNVNMFHISPFACTEAFFRNGTKVLKKGGLIFTYGPYAHNGVLEPQSNINFDCNLRVQDPRWGVRDIADIEKIALECGVKLLKVNDLPANNKCIVWLKFEN